MKKQLRLLPYIGKQRRLLLYVRKQLRLLLLLISKDYPAEKIQIYIRPVTITS